MAKPWENIQPLGIEALPAQLAASGVPQEVWATIARCYERDMSHGARCGLSELLRNLEAEPAGSAEKQDITQNFGALTTIRFEPEHLSLFQLLGEAFGPHQRVMVCSRLLELSRPRFPGVNPSCPGLRQPEVHQAVLKTMLTYGAVTALYEQEDHHEEYATVMCNRLMNLYDYLKNLCESRLVQSLTGDNPSYAISLSGSDPHNRGRQVVFLEEQTGGHWVKVYAIKPHDTRMEHAAGKAIDYISQMLDARYTLPVLPITCWAPPESWGYSAFLTRDGAKTRDEAKRYLGQMGALICITKLLGLGDAHQDNIFSTRDGPVVIDAENVFDPWIMQSRRLFATGIGQALSHKMGDGAISNNYFTVNGEGSTTLFYQREYAEEITRGFVHALHACLRKEDALFEFLDDVYKPIPKIRIVPLATAEFPALALEYYVTHNLNPTRATFSAMLNHLKDDRVDMPLAEWTTRLKDAVIKSFEEGDIPYFELSMYGVGAQYGYVSCNGVNLSRADDLLRKPLKAVLSENLSFLASNSAQVQLRDFLKQ